MVRVEGEKIPSPRLFKTQRGEKDSWVRNTNLLREGKEWADGKKTRPKTEERRGEGLDRPGQV